MATTHIEPGSGYVEETFATIGPRTSALRRPLFPAIRWGAVIAGVAVGISVQLVLTLLGIATGLSALDVAQNDAIGVGSLLWAGASMLISAFVGGYVAARMSGLKRKVDGVLHGLVSWAVTTLLFATLATSAGTSMLGGVFSGIMPNSVSGATSAANALNSLLGLLQSQLGVNIDPAAMGTLLEDIQAGRRESAVEFMVNSMGVERSRAESIVDQALILFGSGEQASQQARAAANQALEAASTAAWTTFLTVALSLALAIAGGAVGAAGARRTTWVDAEDGTARRPM
jgi:hypothetical protein